MPNGICWLTVFREFIFYLLQKEPKIGSIEGATTLYYFIKLGGGRITSRDHVATTTTTTSNTGTITTNTTTGTTTNTITTTILLLLYCT